MGKASFSCDRQDDHGASRLVECYSYWTFSDIFEENYFPSQPFQGGFGLLTINGIAKPAYRAYELLHELGDHALAVSGRHETVDVWVLQSKKTITVLITNSLCRVIRLRPRF